MHIIEPGQFRKKRKAVRWQTRALALCLVVLIILLTSYGAWARSRPLPLLVPQAVHINTPQHQTPIPWPGYGQSAIGALGYSVLGASVGQQAAPMASTAKIVTALAVLQQRPLAIGAQGPLLTLGATDVALYNSYVAEGGSVVAVNDGEQISEYQALQAMLLPSANNMADSLAVWAFGSLDAYTVYANKLTASLGAAHTHVVDGSGFSEQSVSTAADLVVLGEHAMTNPVLAEIVGQKSAQIPIAGTIENVNFMLGQNGIVGIKTGNTDQAGGCFLFAAVHIYGPGQTVTLVGAIMGASSLGAALRDAAPLITAGFNGFGNVTLVRRGQTVGNYSVPWGGSFSALTTQPLTYFGWLANLGQPTVTLKTLSAPVQAGTSVGSVSLHVAGTQLHVPVVTNAGVRLPTAQWRLWH